MPPWIHASLTLGDQFELLRRCIPLFSAASVSVPTNDQWFRGLAALLVDLPSAGAWEQVFAGLPFSYRR